MNKPGVYTITHVASGKKYVGSTVNLRIRWAKHRRELRQGIHHNQKLTRAWAKHGADAFAFAVVEETQDLLAREQFWMDSLQAIGPKGFNLSPIAGTPMPPGPRRPHTEATKAKIRAKRALQVANTAGMHAANTGRKRSPEACAAISAGRKGMVFTAEHRAAISAGRKGVALTAQHRANIAAGVRRAGGKK